MKISILARRRLYSTTYLDPYARAGFSPKLVFDPKADTYRTGGNASTFAGMIDYTGASNKTMVDSDGVLKWAPHNLLKWSEDFTNAAWVAVFSADASRTGAAVTISSNEGAYYVGQNVSLSAAVRTLTFSVYSAVALFSVGIRATTDATELGKAIVSFAAGETKTFTYTSSGAVSQIRIGIDQRDVTMGGSASSSGFTVTISKPHLYRSDLGGMADNPDTGDSYVPTTSAARYLSRRNHHVYEGGEWVNAGMLVEPTAATNLVTYSEDFTNAYWTKGTDVPTLFIDAIGPDGETSAVTLVDNNTGGTGTNLNVLRNVTVSASTPHTLSVFAKANGLGWINLTIASFTTPGTSRAYFNLENGVKGTVDAGFSASSIEDCGNGWYRCSASFTTDVSDTTGQIYIAAASADGNVAVDRDGTSSILIYGAQFEVGSVPSSYIPTAGSTATRAAETVSIAAAKLPFVNPDNLGPELVTNGTFDSDVSGWTVRAGCTISSVGGRLRLTYTGTGAARAFASFSAEVGKTYLVKATGYSLSGASPSAYFQDNSAVDIATKALSSGVEISFLAVANDTTQRIEVGNSGANTPGGFMEVDNVSVREVTALELSIAMRGRMTYADNDSTSEAIFARWFLDGSNEIKTELWTNATNVGAAYFTQRQAGTVDRIGQVVPGSYSPGINVPFSIASRHGSTFINGAVDGTALTADLTPTSLPNLSATNLSLAFSGGPMIIEEFAMWDVDLGDAGIEEASS